MSLRLIIGLLSGQLLFSNSCPSPNRQETISNAEKRVELLLNFPYKERKSYDKNYDSAFFAKVVIKNNADTIASFYEDWNMWGYYNISFQVRSSKGIDTIRKKMRGWDKNIPSYQVLFPGDSMVMHFALEGTNSEESIFEGSFPAIGKGLLGIKAIYRLDSALHAMAGMRDDTIKYRYKRVDEPLVIRKEKGRSGTEGRLVVMDTLQTPIVAKRTFTLVKLESVEYTF